MREAILDLLLKSGAIKIKEIAKSLDVEAADIMDTLRELRTDGYIEFSDGAYHLPKDIKSTPALQELDKLEEKIKIGNSIKPVSEPLLKHAVLKRLSALLHDDISAVLKSIADDLEEYQKLGSV